MANLTQEAQQFLRSTQRGILSTHSKKYSGYPFGSVAPYVVDHQGGLIILISDIAEHTKNIVQDPKVSMVVLADEQDMQANARLTLLGEAAKLDEGEDSQALAERYLRYYPEAKGYFSAHDFNFYRISIRHARYIAGFGKMGWIEGDHLNTVNDDPLPLTAQEASIVDHMNADHVDSLLLYSQYYHNLAGDNAEMLGIDQFGFDIMLDHGEQNQMVRFDFDETIKDAQDARKAMVAMSNTAKAAS